MAAAESSNPSLDQHYAVPQTLVKIGLRRRLNLLIAGEGAPTVIFAAGMNGTTLHWARVQRVIAEKTRTVAFDKAGLGFSDPGPLPRTAAAVVDAGHGIQIEKSEVVIAAIEEVLGLARSR